MYSFLYSDGIVNLAKGEAGPLEVLSSMGRGLAITGMVLTTLHSFSYGVEKPGEGRRVSLFFGAELDRAVILLALAYSSRLAKGIPKDGRPVRTKH